MGFQASTSEQQARSFIDPVQEQHLQGLWNRGSGLAQQGRAAGAARRASRQNRGHIRQAQNTASAIADPTAQIEAQAGSLATGLGNLFQNQIMPGIQSDAIAAGGFGGGRQGVAEGVAAGQLGNAYAQGLGDITANANQQALQAAGMSPALGQANIANRVSPFTAGFEPLQRLAAILGSPTVLNEQSASKESFGFDLPFGG